MTLVGRAAIVIRISEPQSAQNWILMGCLTILANICRCRLTSVGLNITFIDTQLIVFVIDSMSSGEY